MATKQSELEAALATVEVRLACLLAQYRDQPDMQELFGRQRKTLATLRRRLQDDEARDRASVRGLMLRLWRAIRRLAPGLAHGSTNHLDS